MDLITLALARKYVQATLAGAGALKGQDGKSAYEIAQEHGYSGTETEWLESLKGDITGAPSIGANGNWYIGNADTGISARGITNYNDLENRPSINGVTLEGDTIISNIPLTTIRNILYGGEE